MKTPFYKHPQFAKWGLYSLLLASLGFTVSMNPDHYNNIVRHYPLDKAGELLFASSGETASGKPAGAEDIQFYRTGRNNEVIGNTMVKGYFFRNGTQTCATLTEGADGSTRCGLKNDPSNMNDLALEISEKLAASAATPASAVAADGAIAQPAAQAAPAAPVPPSTPANMPSSEEIAAAWGAKCDPITDEDAKLTCHAKRIVEFSKYKAPNIAPVKEEDVLAYFDKYLKDTLTQMFGASPLKRERYGHQIVFEESQDVIDQHNRADEIYSDLLKQLNTTNGSSARKSLMVVYQNAFEKQAKAAQRAVRDGLQTKNQQLVAYGYNRFNQLSHNDLANFDSLTMDALETIQNAGIRTSLTDYYDEKLYSPLGQWLLGITTSAGQTSFDQIQIPGLPNYTGNSISNLISNAPNNVVQARIAIENARTNNLIALSNSGSFNAQGQFTQQIPYLVMPNGTNGVTGPNAGNVLSPSQQQNGVVQPSSMQLNRVGTAPGSVPYGRQ